jgi:YfiH family protein
MESTIQPVPFAQLTHGGLTVVNPAWRAVPGLKHGITTRAALPDHGKADLFQVVFRARDIGALPLAVTLGGDQVHEDHVVTVTEPLHSSTRPPDFRYDAGLAAGEFPATDALVTTLEGALLVIQTADCLPIFLIDPTTHTLGLAHCGWRGLRVNLTAKVVDAMRIAGAQLSQMQAWLGPCIRAERYEVGAELAQEFRTAFPEAGASPNGTHLDLPAIARWQLQQAGLAPEHVFDSGECTNAQVERYHSYRAQGPDAGRMLSFIGFFDQA